MFIRCFYFNVDIWGTVSDWAMVIITAVTFYFIFRSFQQQQNLYKLENMKFKSYVRPGLKLISRLPMRRNIADGKNYLSLNLSSTNHKMYLRKVEIEPSLQRLKSELLVQEYNCFYEIDNPLIISYPYKEFETLSYDSHVSTSYVTVYFDDVVKNRYRQVFRIDHHPDINITTEFSEEITLGETIGKNRFRFRSI
ncbi:MAG: hypothetical protein KKH44_02170 [Bacteroidetes bacterium]|nr:hypothetical protein [Bacteroidota bacterium]